MNIFQNYKWDKIQSKFMKTCYELEYLKMEQQYLMNPRLYDKPILQYIIKIHILKQKMVCMMIKK